MRGDIDPEGGGGNILNPLTSNWAKEVSGTWSPEERALREVLFILCARKGAALNADETVRIAEIVLTALDDMQTGPVKVDFEETFKTVHGRGGSVPSR